MREGRTPSATDPEPEAATSRVRQAVARAVETGEGWENLLIEVECRTAEGPQAVTVFGSGVGVWNGRRQFTLPPSQVAALLQLFHEADFVSFRESYGGRDDPIRPSPGRVLRVTCRVLLQINGARKQSTQLEQGRQSHELKDLAHKILRFCEPPAATGVTADSLTDGLRKLAAGVLAPEVFHLLLHRRLEGNPGSPEGDNWLLRVAQGRGISRIQPPGSEYGVPRGLDLQPGEVADLVLLLLENDVEGLPINLYAPHYTDLIVRVLNHEKVVHARRFARMTPTTHGERQARFDRIFHALEDLHRRVLIRGDLIPEDVN